MSLSLVVHRVATPFMVLPDHVNAYVVETPTSVVVIDSGVAISAGRRVRQVAEATGKPIAAVLLTHGHPDHYTGLVAFPDVPRLASQGCLDFIKAEDLRKAAVAKGYLGDDYPDRRLFPDQIISDGYTFTTGGATFTYRELGPGESDDDGMWVAEAEGVQHAFVGDVVANRCHCFFRDGHAIEWLALLDRLEREFGAHTRIYPGHGEAPADRSLIAWQRGYIRAFLDAVAAVPDRSLPVSRATQEAVIAAMQRYLPGNALLFLLDYELDETLPLFYRLTLPAG